MHTLNFPYQPDRIRVHDGVTQIFDGVRKKWLVLTPEEWVRQHLVLYLQQAKNCPSALLSVEKTLIMNGMKRRYDLVVYGRDAMPLLLAECKAPEVKLTQDVFDQAARYNQVMRVPYLMITNGINHYCCRILFESQTYEFLQEIPAFDEM